MLTQLVVNSMCPASFVYFLYVYICNAMYSSISTDVDNEYGSEEVKTYSRYTEVFSHKDAEIKRSLCYQIRSQNHYTLKKLSLKMNNAG